jgi:hypothetical protein
VDWFTQLGNMAQFMPDTPALAFDMATKGPNHDAFNYSLAYNIQDSPTPLNVYPAEEQPFAPSLGA